MIGRSRSLKPTWSPKVALAKSGFNFHLKKLVIVSSGTLETKCSKLIGTWIQEDPFISAVVVTSNDSILTTTVTVQGRRSKHRVWTRRCEQANEWSMTSGDKTTDRKISTELCHIILYVSPPNNRMIKWISSGVQHSSLIHTVVLIDSMSLGSRVREQCLYHRPWHSDMANIMM
jgi:hypothetical protein